MFTHPSISRRLTLALGAVFLLFGSITLGIYYSFQKAAVQGRLGDLGEEYSRVITSALAYPLWNLDKESVSATSEAFVSNDVIVSLRVRDNVGEPLFDYDITSEFASAWQYTGSVVYGEYAVGGFEVGLTDYYFHKHNRETLVMGCVMILLCFGILILMTRVLLHLFLRDPLLALQQVSRNFEIGEYRAGLETTVPREFAEFVKTLSRMGATIDSQFLSLKKAEEELKQHSDNLESLVEERTNEILEKEQRLQAILTASPVGIALVVDRHLDYANDRLYRMLGYEPGTLTGKSSEMFYVDHDEYVRVGHDLEKLLETEQIASVDVRLVDSDGNILECQVRAFMLDRERPEKGQIIVVSDVTEANRLREKLQRAEKMEAVGTLAGGVAHDLNNILSGIVSYPEVLLLDMEENDSLRKPLETIRKSGERAVKIVQDLLTMARRGVSVLEVTNLNDLVKEQLASPEMKKLLDYHPGVHVSTDLEGDLLNVKGSPTHLAKSLMNLLSNAAEAMTESGGTITIKTRNYHLDNPVRRYEEIPTGDYVWMEVSDTGIGISEQDKQRIFEPFYTKKTMGRSGTGLGMPVVWGTVKDHGGYVDIESSEGEGTCFSIYLPATREEKRLDAEQFTIEEYRGGGERILVVDDVDVQREIARVMLEKLGYRVEVASSGEEAVVFLERAEVDLLLLDMVMDPGMDGLDTYRKVLSIHPRQRAIVASGFSQTDRVRDILDLGAGAYVKKPYTLKKLAMAVQEELKRSGRS